MKKWTYVVLVMNVYLILAIVPASLLRVTPVNAHSGVLLSAWAASPPTIDGNINDDTEWVMADKEPFVIGGSYSGTLYVMNDATNLYLAVRIADDDFGTNASTRDFVSFFFDADHDGVGPEIGDDSLVCISMSMYLDQFFQDPSYAWDNLEGGTNDGVVGASGDGVHNEFEISHPLNSTDDAHDFSLTIGDTIGFMMSYGDNNAYVGNWPASASPYSNPTDWHEIKIASSIYQGDLILVDNDVHTIVGSFAINGSIIVKDNATLILKDASVNFTQTLSSQFNLTLKEPSNGNPKLQISNTTLESAYILHIYLYGNSTVSANRLRAYHEINLFDESSGNITDSPVLWTINCYDLSMSRFVNSQLVQMRMRDSSKLLFSDSNATNFIEAYNDSSINASNSRIRVLGTYNSAQAAIYNSTFTYFNDQGSNYASFVNMTRSTITDEFRSWGNSQIIFSNSTINFSDIDSYSTITYSDCDINGIRTRFSATVIIKDQCTASGSIIAEENSTLILDHAFLNFTQAANWQLNITLTNPIGGSPRLQIINTTTTSNFRYSIGLFENSSASIHNSEFIASPGYYGWLFLWDSSQVLFADSTIHGLSSFTSTALSLLNSSVNNLNIYTPANVSIYESNIDTMNTYLDAAISAEKSSIIAAQAFDNSHQFLSDSTINLIHTYNKTSMILTNSTCSSLTLENESQVFVYWYVDIHVVDSLYNNVPAANVTASFQNATQAQSELTDLNGWVRLTLMEKMMNTTGNYSVGSYSLEATYLIYSNTTTANMTGNQQLTITLEDFIIPELQFFQVMLMFTVSTLLAIMVYKRKHDNQLGRCMIRARIFENLSEVD